MIKSPINSATLGWGGGTGIGEGAKAGCHVKVMVEVVHVPDIANTQLWEALIPVGNGTGCFPWL